jgi:hypothetical protein
VYEIFEGEDDAMFVVLDGLFDACEVLGFALLLLFPVLDEFCELTLHVFVQLHLRQFAPLHKHGAKILSIKSATDL